MRIVAPVACLLVVNLLVSPIAAANTRPAADTASSRFQVGSKPANSGRGFSLFTSFVNSTYRVECNCADFSVDIRVCNSSNYQCNCAPKAILSCAPL